MSLINREPMGKVIFKDGHEEPLIECHVCSIDSITFKTVSGKYAYRSWIETHESGFQYIRYNFYKFMEDGRWYIIDDIYSVEFY